MQDKRKVRKISLNECVAGMRIANDIFSAAGSLIMPAGSTLDDYTISRLRGIAVSDLTVYEADTVAEDASELQIFADDYANNVDCMKEIFGALENGNLLRMDTVRTIVSGMIDCSIGSRDILHSLNRLRNIDEYTYNHSLNVGILAMMLGRWVGMEEEAIPLICSAGVLHDVGKARVPNDILNKPGSLSVEEFDAIKQHSMEGYRILMETPDSVEDVRQGVLMHHERIDGSGYPLGVAAGDIHRIAKIIAIADVYDAMVSDRCYHTKDNPFNVLEHFETQGLGHLDSKYTATFIQKMSAYFIGERVTLSDGRTGEVTFINAFRLSRPVIQVDGQVIDLSRDKTIDIVDLALD